MRTKEGMHYFVAWVVSLYFSTLSLVSVVNYGTGYDWKICSIVVFVFLVWTIMLFMNLRRISFSKLVFLVILILSFLTAAFLASAVWADGRGLSLNPIKLLVENNLHPDNLYHSSIAAGWGYYNKSSLLINGLSKIFYHSFSHLLIGKLSKWLCIPTYFVYNYLYPVIFIPLYVFFLLRTILVLKIYFSNCEQNKLNCADLFTVAIFIVGFLPSCILSDCALWLTSEIDSETYLISRILVLVYINLLLFLIGNCGKKGVCVTYFLLNPLFIFLCSFCKISIGILLCAGIMWYFFRKYTKDIKYWILNLFYFGVFLSYYAISAKNMSGHRLGSDAGLYLFHFVRTFTKSGCGILHYIVLLSFSSLFFYLRFSKKKVSIKGLLFSKENIIEEILFVVCVVGILPGLFISIRGGSAGYFSYPQMMAGAVLLCAFDYPAKIFNTVRQNKGWGKFASTLFLIVSVSSILFNSDFVSYTKKNFMSRVKYSCEKPLEFKRELKEIVKQDGLGASFKYFWNVVWANNKYTKTAFYQNILAINEFTKRNKRDYCVFVEENAELLELYKEPWEATRKAVYVYPAFLNLICLNNVYMDEDSFYNPRGQSIASRHKPIYGLGTVNVEERKTFDIVLQEAKIAGFKYIIRFYEDKYEIVNLN